MLYDQLFFATGGSLFLFDRKVLRYFRKDGHTWRKKKDGKTVKEAHERLKSGSIDVLHCYYAHGEQNESFQRRSYWMLEEELSHIVLVHYREVKGNRTNFNRIKQNEDATARHQETEDSLPNSEMDTSVSSNFHHDSNQVPAQTTDTVSMTSAQASEYEDAESVYNHQATSGFHAFLEMHQPATENINAGLSNHHDPGLISSNYQEKLPAVRRREFVSEVDKTEETNQAALAYQPQKHFDLPSREDVLENYAPGTETSTFQHPFSSQALPAGIIPKQEEEILRQLFTYNLDKKQEPWSHLPVQREWNTFEGASSHFSKRVVDQKFHPDLTYDFSTASSREKEFTSGDLLNTLDRLETREGDHPVQHDVQPQLSNTEYNMTLEGKSICSLAAKQHLFDHSLSGEGLKKLDSFNRWMSKELGDVNASHVHSTSAAYWDAVESENVMDVAKIPSQMHLDTYVLGPSLSNHQLFSIIDFSPNWTYIGSEVKVFVTGRFLNDREEAENLKWSCMFGEVEVQADVIADGVLCCQTPLNKAGTVPFYVTCSDRVACSEVREFEFRLGHIQDMNINENYSNSTSSVHLHMRFGKFLSLSSAPVPEFDTSDIGQSSQLSNKISSFLKEDTDEWDQLLNLTTEGVSLERVKEEFLQKLLKDKLHVWLLQKAAEGGKGPSVLDEGGQGVLHFAAALGYDWALEPTIIAGVSVNFRDANGWTALHWAASCGRERTVASLILLGAAPGVLTDPTPKYPDGRTPADLASAEGHKGIAGYLAESALSAHLSSLNLDKQDNDKAEISGAKSAQIVPAHMTSISNEDLPSGQSLKDSLAAVCNATQTAARIHQVFRVQSFQKKQFKEIGGDKFGISNERALSLIGVKANKQGQNDEPVHAAAVRIQNKFRGWKGRKEFLIIRQRIVKIQAHVRGHQVRKNYRKIVWSVGIVEKVILRWRRKRSGLRGFKSEALTEGPSKTDTMSKEEDDDFFKEGRKQTEARSKIALARVKSMHQNPEARDQYRRLLNVVNEIQENKAVPNNNTDSEAMAEFDDLIDLDALLDDDTFMHVAS
ncbi:calmodulin-binding transcription activator 3 isoform X2 [Mercurialis annua]|uniref:calmodulin-binding transcription activator 3 isoform X2 n=1 Tax=Mercurialis annua TaxID=3986 RepID=UPI00215FCF21|nr:calmodulin-binding transcription activator 3 isoform X2 [Mercurialis annua]